MDMGIGRARRTDALRKLGIKDTVGDCFSLRVGISGKDIEFDVSAVDPEKILTHILTRVYECGLYTGYEGHRNAMKALL